MRCAVKRSLVWVLAIIAVSTLHMIDAGVGIAGAEEYKIKVPLGLPPVEIPADNPMSAEKVALGSRLYFDPMLSVDNTVSCATCHDPAKGFADGRPVARGVNGAEGTRNSPTTLNAVYNNSQFWDGRVRTLEEQALGPMTNPIEMAMPSHDAVVARLKGVPTYVDAFEAVFGTRDFTIDEVVKAIAAFERTLLSGNSLFDKFQYARKFKIWSKSARRGLDLFHGKANCQTCHIFLGYYATFSDDRFHNLGVGMNEDVLSLVRKVEKLGDVPKGTDPLLISELGRFMVTKQLSDIGAFRTPTLRNVELTAPYMHDGSQATLEDVIEFYAEGGRKNPYLSKDMKPLELTPGEKADLVELLKAMTGGE